MAEKKKKFDFGIGGKLNIFGLEIDLEKLLSEEGVEKGIKGLEELREKVEGKKLSLSAEGPYRKYYRDEELDYPVESEFKTNYRNGILEVTLTKKEA